MFTQKNDANEFMTCALKQRLFQDEAKKKKSLFPVGCAHLNFGANVCLACLFVCFLFVCLFCFVLFCVFVLFFVFVFCLFVFCFCFLFCFGFVLFWVFFVLFLFFVFWYVCLFACYEFNFFTDKKSALLLILNTFAIYYFY